MQYVEELREQKQRNQDSAPDRLSTLWKQRLFKMVCSDKIAANVVPFFFYKAKILNRNPFDKNIDFIKDLDQA